VTRQAAFASAEIAGQAAVAVTAIARRSASLPWILPRLSGVIRSSQHQKNTRTSACGWLAVTSLERSKEKPPQMNNLISAKFLMSSIKPPRCRSICGFHGSRFLLNSVISGMTGTAGAIALRKLGETSSEFL